MLAKEKYLYTGGANIRGRFFSLGNTAFGDEDWISTANSHKHGQIHSYAIDFAYAYRNKWGQSDEG